MPAPSHPGRIACHDNSSATGLAYTICSRTGESQGRDGRCNDKSGDGNGELHFDSVEEVLALWLAGGHSDCKTDLRMVPFERKESARVKVQSFGGSKA
jgi:hypothetical protein